MRIAWDWMRDTLELMAVSLEADISTREAFPTDLRVTASIKKALTATQEALDEITNACARQEMLNDAAPALRYRLGSKIKLNVYDGDRPMCQCHNDADAMEIVAALNQAVGAKERVR